MIRPDRFYGKTFPNFNEIKELKSGTIYMNDEVINVIYNNEFGYLHDRNNS